MTPTSQPKPDAPPAEAAAAPGLDPGLCPGLPIQRDSAGAEAPVFAEPWQAQAFAMVLALHQRGLFTWPEWAEALSGRIRAAQAAGDPDPGDTYYHHWLAALEQLVARKGAGSPAELDRTASAWARAADRTPHGQPIALRPQDFDAA